MRKSKPGFPRVRYEEIERQNQDLLENVAGAASKAGGSSLLNSELEDTNRGVVAALRRARRTRELSPTCIRAEDKLPVRHLPTSFARR